MEIQFLKRQGLSERHIARRLGMDPRTVKKYAADPKAAGTYRRQKPHKSQLDPFREQIHLWLDEDEGYTAVWIYDRLKPLGYTGSYSVVKRYVSGRKQSFHRLAYLRFESEPGRQAQVDFGEFAVEEPLGTVRKLFLFAMILGYSRKLYGELVERCDLMTFLDCHVRAFEYFGGVPLEILYDRMKNVFIRRLAGRDLLNLSLVSFALHHRFQPQVTPPYAPWVKGKVERPFSFIREGFWRGYGFTCLERANQDILSWLSVKEQRIHGTTHERVADRFEREKPFLLPLPAQPFDTSYRLWRNTGKDCLVHFDCNRFMVPHTLAGERLVLRVKDNALRVFQDDRLVASYTIPQGKGHLVADPRFKDALLSDREMNRRKYATPPPQKGRARLVTFSPSIPAYALPVEARSMDIYAALGGEVRHE